MRLVCLNDSCEHTCADYEVRDVYTPECPVCWTSMAPLGETPDPRFDELAAAEEKRLADADAWYLERKGVIELPEPSPSFLRIRQAG